jgi:hypothetical protein
MPGQLQVFRLTKELPGERRLENLENRENRDSTSLEQARSVSGKDLQAALDKNPQKFETFSKLGQIPQGLTMAEIDALTPEEVKALKPMPFGIDLGDGTVVLADKTLIAQANKENTQISAPAMSGARLIEIAERLGDDKHRWESTTTGKCNQFVDAVFRNAGVPVPWDGAHVPDCHGMNSALDKECQMTNPVWEKVYSYDFNHAADSDQRFTHYDPKNGDIIIWDKAWGDKWVQHAGIAVEPYDIKYAGAHDEPHHPPKHGVGKTNIYNYTGQPPFGSPSSVYRYAGLQ